MAHDIGSDPAFACATAFSPHNSEHVYHGAPGISTRLYIATAALQGILAEGSCLDVADAHTYAREALAFADALLAEASNAPAQPPAGGEERSCE